MAVCSLFLRLACFHLIAAHASLCGLKAEHELLELSRLVRSSSGVHSAAESSRALHVHAGGAIKRHDGGCARTEFMPSLRRGEQLLHFLLKRRWNGHNSGQ